MQLTSFVADLKKVLPPEDFGYTVAALHQDPLVWESLSQPDFFQQALAFAGGSPELWNPASLALLALGKSLPVETLCSLPLVPISADLRQRAARQYEDTYRTAASPTTLAEAGLLALALRERRRLTDSWQGLHSELQLNTSANAALSLATWRTPLACLYGMSPDPVDLLKALIPANVTTEDLSLVALLAHALLSNPLSLPNQARVLADILSSLVPDRQIGWLAWIKEQGRSELAAQVAGSLLRAKAGVSLIALAGSPKTQRSSRAPLPKFGADPLVSQEPMSSVTTRLQLASLYQLAGRSADAVSVLTSAEETLRRIQASLATQLASASVENGDLSASLSILEKTVTLVPDSAVARASLAASLMKVGKSSEISLYLPEDSTHPLVLLAGAQAAFETGDVPRAQGYAQQVADYVLQYRTDLAAPGSLFSRDQFVALAGMLLKLHLHDSAVQVCDLAVGLYPADLELHEVRSRACQAKGNLEKAAQDIQLAAAIRPEQVSYHRLLADILAEAGDWDQSLAERIQVTQQTPEPAVSDLQATAQTALRARQPEKAAEACQVILSQQPEDGLAHAYLGESLAMQGDPLGAIQHFTQATLLAPEQPAPWIALAKTYEASGDHRKALDTLKAASIASPLSAEINLSLGQAYLAEGSPSDALPPLRKAASLDPQTTAISLRLGETLLDLGRLTEANQVLTRARQAWPTHPDLAFIHGKTLLALGQDEAAIPALKVALAGQPKSVEPYLLFGRTVVNLVQAGPNTNIPTSLPASTQPVGLNDAQQALQKVVEMDPDNFEARVLSAETQAVGGLLTESMQSYLRLAESETAKQPAWSWRINLGLGRVAVALKQMDTAIAALQEAAQIKPDDLQIQHALAEAYMQADLGDEALQKAKTALRLAPQDIQNLQWYAKVALALRNNAEAIQALETATEEAPHHADLTLELAQIQAQTGDEIAARETLKTLSKNDQVSPAELHKAAHLSAALGDSHAAIGFLEKAIGKSTDPQPGYWAELAGLQRKLSNPAAAVEAIQKALDLHQQDPKFYVLQADLMYEQNRHPEALAGYERALQLLEMSQLPRDESLQGLTASGVKTAPSHAVNFPKWKILLRIASLERLMGDLPGALAHAEMAVAGEPAKTEASSAAADLALALLDYPKAEALISQAVASCSPAEPGASIVPLSGDLLYTLKLLCTQAEIHLERGNLAAAEGILEEGKAISTTYPRLLAGLSRLASSRGEFDVAGRLLDQAITNLDKTEGTNPAAPQPKRAPSLESDLVLADWTEKPAFLTADYPTLPVAEAALNLHQWEVALPLFYQAARTAPLEPQSQLALARALVRAAENQYHYHRLHAAKHAPGAERTNEVAYQQFQKAILTANRLSSAEEITRWHHRGEAIFNPGPQTAHLLPGQTAQPGDVAAQVRALMQMDDCETAAEVAESSEASQDPDVLFQQALAQMEKHPHKSLAAARKVVEQQPANPIHQALLAYSAEAAGDLETASLALETALGTWPNEPEWHAAAARLQSARGNTLAALDHWKKTVDLDPDSAEFTCALGQAYLAIGDSHSAVASLEKAAALDGEKLLPWIELAHAYSAAGDYPQATQCAERAITLAPNEIGPVVLSGEIALQSGELKHAAERAEVALTLDPHNPEAVLLQVQTLLALNKPQEALAVIDKALPGMKEAFPVLLERAKLVRQVHGLEPALQALELLAGQYPEEPGSLSLLAEAQAEAGQRDAAVKSAQAALLLLPNQAGLHLLLGRILRGSGQLDQAVHHLSEAIRLSPNEADAYLELGKAHQERREYTQALKVLKLGTEIAPKDARMFYQSGLACKDTKDYGYAETMLRRAAELAPEDLSIRRQLGAIIALNLVHQKQEASVK